MEGDLTGILGALKGMWPGLGYVLMGLGVLVVGGRLYVSLTPNQEDDAWWAALESKPIIGPILRALASFSPVGRAMAADKPLKKKR